MRDRLPPLRSPDHELFNEAYVMCLHSNNSLASHRPTRQFSRERLLWLAQTHTYLR